MKKSEATQTGEVEEMARAGEARRRASKSVQSVRILIFDLNIAEIIKLNLLPNAATAEMHKKHLISG